MPGRPLDIFLSYAHADGEPLARALHGRLLTDHHHPWLDRPQIDGGDTWSLEIEQAIDNCDAVLAVLSDRYYDSAICRLEIHRAFRMSKRIIPVLAHPGQAQADAKRFLFIDGTHYLDFTHDFDTAYATLDQTLSGTDRALLREEFRVGTSITVFGAPPVIPDHLKIDRADKVAKLRDLLLSGHGKTIALTAVAGQGGLGKSVLASFLFHDEIVRQAFPGGVFWINVGRQPKLVLLGQRILKALGEDPAEYPDESSCRVRFRELMRERAALVILDDLWNVGPLDFFAVDTPRSRVLFTTRIAAIADHKHAAIHRLDLLSIPEARRLLANAAECDEADLPGSAEALVRECGQLPLAISQIGAVLRRADPPFWQDVLARVQKADLDAIRELLPDGQDPYFRATEVSVDALPEKLKTRYRALAVLLEDRPATLPVIGILWEMTESEARVTAKQLADRSLVQFADGILTLHDLQFDYLRALHTDRESLDLIHGALRLSEHVLDRDPHQFAGQTIGRLLAYQDRETIREFMEALARGASRSGRPWLRPRWPALHPPGTGLLRTLEGHTAGVCGVAVTPDGQRAVSASADRTLKLWDVDTGQPLRTLTGHTDSVKGVALSADGRCVVSASTDYTLKVWDVDTGQPLRTLTGHTDAVKGVALSADGRRVVSASRDKTLKVWDAISGTELCSLASHTREVNGVALSADGRRAISASADCTLKVWDVRQAVVRAQHLLTVLELQARAAVPWDDPLYVRYDDRGQELRTLAGHTLAVNGVALSADGRRAVSASDDCTLKVWDVDTGKELHTLIGHTWPILGVTLSADGRQAVSTSADETLKVWDVDEGHELHELSGHTNSVCGVALSANGRLAVSASLDEALKVWDLHNGGREPRARDRHRAMVTGVASSADGRLAVSASWDQTLKVWDVDTGQVLRTLGPTDHTRLALSGSDGILGVTLSGDGDRAISASDDKKLTVWDVNTGQVLRVLTGHTTGVFGVAMSADGRRAVSAAFHDELKGWDVDTGQELRSFSCHPSFVTGVALSADGRRAVSASGDHTLMVWDVNTGQRVRELKGHTEMYVVALSADGHRAVSASRDDTLTLWDVNTGQEVRTFVRHTSSVPGLALSADGRRAASAYRDKTLAVWDCSSGRCLATFTCDSEAYCCTFANSRHVLAGDAGGHVYCLEIVYPKGTKT